MGPNWIFKSQFRQEIAFLVFGNSCRKIFVWRFAGQMDYFGFVNSDHGTIIRTGITCRKVPCYMRDSACRWFIVKKAKIF